MGKAWRWGKYSFKRTGLDAVLDKVVREFFAGDNRPQKPRRIGGAGAPKKPQRQSFTLEAIEPRLLLSADLTYGAPGSIPGDITSAVDVGNYISSLTATTFVLKAEESGGNAFGTSMGPAWMAPDRWRLLRPSRLPRRSTLM